MRANLFISKFKYQIIFLGFSSVIVSSFFSSILFSAQADIIMVLLTTLAVSPFIYYTIKMEEKYDMNAKNEKNMLKHHFHIFKLYILLFFGVLLGYIMLYLFLPLLTVQNLFDLQILTLSSSHSINGFFTSFFSIFLNNFAILFLSFVLSLFYGTGAILILIWNASVISVMFGELIRNLFNKGGLFNPILFLHFIFIIPEILAYFIGGLAGGIISIATIKHHYKSKKFYNVLKDSTYLIIISILLLLVSAFLEVLII